MLCRCEMFPINVFFIYFFFFIWQLVLNIFCFEVKKMKWKVWKWLLSKCTNSIPSKYWISCSTRTSTNSTWAHTDICSRHRQVKHKNIKPTQIQNSGLRKYLSFSLFSTIFFSFQALYIPWKLHLLVLIEYGVCMLLVPIMLHIVGQIAFLP